MERTTALVQTEISLHQIIKGLESLAQTYPPERLAPEQIERIGIAMHFLKRRLEEYTSSQKKERRTGPKDRRKVFDVGVMRFRRTSTRGRRNADTVAYISLPRTYNHV